ncbi:MAG: hypothetical protein JW850_20080 [Thermoflexales bacterium]|nr:hypothetical protein [Thermoflexales bacterium]
MNCELESSHYTVHHDQAVDVRIASDVALLRERLLAAFPQLEALVLVGGFGRGEGSVLCEKGDLTPVNDYDLVMLNQRPVDRDFLGQLRRELAQQLGISWVDISVYSPARWKKLAYTMYHYDLKYAGRVIYGDPGVLALIPDMVAQKMPLAEAEIQFYVRLWCFLGPFSTRFLAQTATEEERFFLACQFSKALLACSDALLILHGLYHPSYAERLRRFEAAFGDRTDRLTLIREATEFKLRPTRDVRYDVVERWFQVRRVYLDTMWSFVGAMYQRKFRDWPAYTWYYRNNPRRVLRRLAHVLVRRSLRHEKHVSVNLAQLFLLLAFEPEKVDAGFLGLAQLELGRVTRSNLSELDWEAARAMAAQLRMDV